MATDAFGAVLSALSDSTRRSILERLARGPARVGEIAAPYTMSLNAVSKHLKVLERAGLVRRVRRGRDHFLTLNAKPLREVARWALRYERYWNEKLDLLEAHFAKRSRRR
ncbi:MAG: winged helix-turn-helix transcriptional regulator [Bradyrhizobiaceae bacterium]|nr:winged helix-turn-helix transcriptional regulator [Bradyrhizobiaceae bacterium]